MQLTHPGELFKCVFMLPPPPPPPLLLSKVTAGNRKLPPSIVFRVGALDISAIFKKE